MQPDYNKLLAFYNEVADMTMNHSVAYFPKGNRGEWESVAVVYPKDLGAALEHVDPEWWKSK